MTTGCHTTDEKYLSSIPSCSPTQNHIWIDGDKQWSSCVWRRRKNGQSRSAGIGPEGCSAKAGAGFDHEYLKLELSYPVQHMFVCIFSASFNQPLLFSTSSVKGKQNCGCRTGKHFDKDDILSQRLYYRVEYL